MNHADSTRDRKAESGKSLVLVAGFSVFILILIFIITSISGMVRKGRESALQGTEENSPGIYPWLGIEDGSVPQGRKNRSAVAARLVAAFNDTSVETLGYFLSWASPLRDFDVGLSAFSFCA